ncbi:hypothetical protein [Mesomycoplasma conjunctivae]|uniref:hypothetical protein n=1 Tax=Mesomycoplasma conjunctivae TaxID=45361 RepID=UPI003DA372EB
MSSFQTKIKKYWKLLPITLVPFAFVSCIEPYVEIRKEINRQLLPQSRPEVNLNNTDEPSKSNIIDPTIEDVSNNLVNNSRLSLNGRKKNPKIPQNKFNPDKNYLTEFKDASFQKGEKYGLMNYWYFLQSTPYILEKDGFRDFTLTSYKEEYLKKLDYLSEKLKSYNYNNLNKYTTNGKRHDVWLTEIKEFSKSIGSKSDSSFHDTLQPPFETEKLFKIIKDELGKDVENSLVRKMIVYDFIYGNFYADPITMYEGEFRNNDDRFVRFFRDDYYIQKNYQPNSKEKLWYSLLLLVQDVQRAYQGQGAVYFVLSKMEAFERALFEINNSDQPLAKQVENMKNTIDELVGTIRDFLLPDKHISLRKDLVFNIDPEQNLDMQSLASDFIEYYNKKVAPLIWKYNNETEDEKIEPLDQQVNTFYLKEYVYPLLNGTRITVLDPDKENQISERAWQTWRNQFESQFQLKYQEQINSLQQNNSTEN